MKQIIIATYNIRHGADVACDWSLLAEIIHHSKADIVGIQEVDMGTNRIGGRDTMAGLCKATDFPYGLFVPAMNYDGGQYGTAILSRYPMERSEYHPLDAGNYEPRAFGCVTVTLEEGRRLCFLNTHLSYESVGQQTVQFHQLADWMATHIPAAVPTVLTGDFNTEDFSAFAPICNTGFSLVNNSETTYKSFRNPPLAIDNIAYRTDCFTPIERGMIESDRSDHNLLWCRFALL